MKSSGSISLSVHRNSVERRRKKLLRSELRLHVDRLVRDTDPRAYAVVVIGSDGRSHTVWDTGAIMPMWGFPETCAAIIRRDMEESGIEEDWKPSLPLKGSE